MLATPTSVVAAMFDAVRRHLLDAALHCRDREIESRCESVSRALTLVSDLYAGIAVDAGDDWSVQTEKLLRAVLVRLPLINTRNDPALAEQLAEVLEPVRLAWNACDETSEFAMGPVMESQVVDDASYAPMQAAD